MSEEEKRENESRFLSWGGTGFQGRVEVRGAEGTAWWVEAEHLSWGGRGNTAEVRQERGG